MTQLEINSAVEAFMSAVENDANLKKSFAICANAQEVVKLAKENDFAFSGDDYESYVEELSNAYDDLPSTVTMSGLVRCPSKWPT